MRFRRLIEDYLNPEIKDLQRDLMDLGRAQIFSPPCFSFLLLLSASSILQKHRRGKQGKEGEQNLAAAVDGNEGCGRGGGTVEKNLDR